jgi:hypothetical protein
MNRNIASRRDFIAGVIGAGLAGSLMPRAVFGATDTSTAETNLSEEGFVSIFDGKTLNGWHTNPKPIVHGKGGHWEVESGAITGEQDPPGSGNGGVLLTDQEYGDFELLLELNPDWGIDSGVFLHTNEQGVCFQVYCDYHDHGNIGWISTETTSGQKRMIIRPFNLFGTLDEQGKLKSLATKPDERPVAWKPDYLVYSATPEQWLSTWKIGEWNTLRVRCVGEYPHITTWINNTKMAEFDGSTCPQPDYNKDEILKQLGRKGPIGLQVHGTKGMWKKGSKCRWRNIRVKQL